MRRQSLPSLTLRKAILQSVGTWEWKSEHFVRNAAVHICKQISWPSALGYYSCQSPCYYCSRLSKIQQFTFYAAHLMVKRFCWSASATSIRWGKCHCSGRFASRPKYQALLEHMNVCKKRLSLFERGAQVSYLYLRRILDDHPQAHHLNIELVLCFLNKTYSLSDHTIPQAPLHTTSRRFK